MIEGSVHVLRVSKESDPEPWTYRVSFAPYIGDGGRVAGRNVSGDHELRKFLGNGVRIDAAKTVEAIKEARRGRATVTHVQLTLEQAHQLGLTA